MKGGKAFIDITARDSSACRERNREHAKRSRVRKKILLEALQQSVSLLQQENEKLRHAIKENLGNEAGELLASTTKPNHGLIASSYQDATKVLADPDYSLVKALRTAQQTTRSFLLVVVSSS